MFEYASFEDKLEDITKPISKKEPVGRSLVHEGIYDDIRRARTDEDDHLPQGIWQRPLKKVNWRGVESLCYRSLKNDSKDLQIMMWLTESWLNLYQLEGLRYGIEGMIKLCDLFWDGLYPQHRQGDDEFRLSPFEWIDEKVSTQLSLFPLTSPTSDRMKPYSFLNWQLATKLAGMTGRAEQDELRRFKEEGKPTLEQFNASRDATPTLHFQTLHQQALEIIKAIQNLNKLLNHKKVRGYSALRHIHHSLENITQFLEFVLKGRGLDPAESMSQRTSNVESKTPKNSPPPKKEISMDKQKNDAYKISNRDEAYMLLDQIANYLSHIEPHSPTPLLIRRAIAWGKMSLTEVLQELVQDKGDLLKIQSLLGTQPKSNSN